MKVSAFLKEFHFSATAPQKSSSQMFGSLFSCVTGLVNKAYGHSATPGSANKLEALIIRKTMV